MRLLLIAFLIYWTRNSLPNKKMRLLVITGMIIITKHTC
jgi:hypothetical protein